MRRQAFAGCLGLALSIGGTAEAHQLQTLDRYQLDAVTAGALRHAPPVSGGVNTQSPFIGGVLRGGGTSFDRFVGGSAPPTFRSQPTSSTNLMVTPEGAAEISTRGTLFNRRGPFSSITLGLYQAEVTATGEGSGSASFNGIAEGDIAATQQSTYVLADGTIVGWTLGIAVNNPF